MRTLVISGFIKLVPDDFNDDDMFIDDDNLLELLDDENYEVRNIAVQNMKYL